MPVKKDPFGTNIYGEAVDCFTLTNPSGLRVRIMTHGGVILSIEAPDRDGTFADIVFGHDTAEEYTADTPFFGCITGRFANRINRGRFTLEGKEVQLATNNNEKHHLHGGERGFDKRIWTPTLLEEQNGVRLEYRSPDGEENYPGNLPVRVTYTLTDHNELRIRYEAETDQPTPINLTNHSYFNLAGHNAGDCLDHRVVINADSFLPTDADSIPTGEIRSVKNTPFDFQTLETIGSRIDEDDEQLRFALGYDHNYCLGTDGEMKPAAKVIEPHSGRVLETFTTEPGVQFYTGNHLEGNVRGKGGFVYPFRGGFCLETQHWPDSPNHPNFPDTLLRPGKTLFSETVYRFSVETQPCGQGVSSSTSTR